MYAILPERYSKRIGAGGWLSLHDNHNGVNPVDCFIVPWHAICRIFCFYLLGILANHTF